MACQPCEVKFSLRPTYFDCPEFTDASGHKRTVRVVIAPNTVSPHSKIPDGIHISYFCNYGRACYNRACDYCRNGRCARCPTSACHPSDSDRRASFVGPSRSLALGHS